MNTSDNSLVASFWIAVVLRTIGNVNAIPGTGPKLLPAPKIYVLPVVLWGCFDILANFGRERIASALAWLTVLATLLLGGTAKTVINGFQTFINAYAPPATPAPAPSTGTSPSTNQIV